MSGWTGIERSTMRRPLDARRSRSCAWPVRPVRCSCVALPPDDDGGDRGERRRRAAGTTRLRTAPREAAPRSSTSADRGAPGPGARRPIALPRRRGRHPRRGRRAAARRVCPGSPERHHGVAAGRGRARAFGASACGTATGRRPPISSARQSANWRISLPETSCITPRPNCAAGPLIRRSVSTATRVPSRDGLHHRRDRRGGGALRRARRWASRAQDRAVRRPRRPPRSVTVPW